jgi:hypothetical protein
MLLHRHPTSPEPSLFSVHKRTRPPGHGNESMPVVCDLLPDSVRGEVALDIAGRECPQMVADALVRRAHLEVAPADRLHAPQEKGQLKKPRIECSAFAGPS